MKLQGLGLRGAGTEWICGGCTGVRMMTLPTVAWRFRDWASRKMCSNLLRAPCLSVLITTGAIYLSSAASQQPIPLAETLLPLSLCEAGLAAQRRRFLRPASKRPIVIGHIWRLKKSEELEGLVLLIMSILQPLWSMLGAQDPGCRKKLLLQAVESVDLISCS